MVKMLFVRHAKFALAGIIGFTLVDKAICSPAYTPAPNGYTVTGQNVTGSGTNTTGAYFLDTAPISYKLTIGPGVDLGNTTALGNSNEIDIAYGSVLNRGTLNASNNGVNFQNTGSVVNRGTISGDQDGVFSTGSLSVVNSGLIEGTSQAAVYSDFSGGNSGAHNYTLVNSGTLMGGDGYDAFSNNTVAFGTDTLKTVISVNNSGTITATSSGLNFDNDNENSGGQALNSLTINNSGTVNALYAIDVDDFYNEDNAGTSTNDITINNTGALNSSSENYLSVENEDTVGGINNIYLKNSGTVTSTSEYGFEIEAENNGVSGNAVGNVTVVNSGSMTSGYDTIYVEDYNEYGSGSGAINISIKNSGSITSTGRYGIDLDDEDYNYENGGNSKIAVSIINSGTITAAEGGVYVEPYNESDSGNGVTHMYFNNSGTITAGSDQGYENGDGGNYSEVGSGTNYNYNTFINSGSISSTGDDAVDSYIYNGDNTGANVTRDYFSNSGAITSSDREGVYFYDDNYTNGGSGTNFLTVINTASGRVSSMEEGIDLEVYNTNDGGSRNSNTLVFTNAGTVDSSGGEGVYVKAENTNSPGDASNSITITNSGEMSGDQGFIAQIENTNTVGSASGSIHLVNSGTIFGNGTYGVELDNEDSGNTGSARSSMNVVNTSLGVIAGVENGVIISSSVSSPNYTTRITNYGAIESLGNAIDATADYVSILSKGGLISGTNAVLLEGTNSSVTIQGRTDVGGTLQGSGNAGNQLNFKLAGGTPTEIAAAKAEIATIGAGAGTITLAGQSYNYDGFESVNLQANSFAHSVDAGLGQLASKIDQNPLPASYDLVYSQGFANPNATLNSLSGRQFLDSFRQIGLSNATAISELADNRAFQLRSGSTGLDFSGLNVNPASMIASLGDTQNLLGRLGASSLFGGTTMSDSKDEKSMTSPAQGPRWGAWASGTVTFADKSATSDDPGYNGVSGSPTVGVDYKVCPELVVGALFNYTRGNVDFNDGSNLDTDSELGAVYADWTHDHFYVDGLVGYGHTSYDQSRRALDGSNAYASPDGDEVLATINSGYDFKIGGFLISPEAGVQYTHLSKDGFSETGAEAYNLNVGDEDVDSFRTKVGFHASHLFNFAGLKLNPEVNAAWYHECFNETTGVSTSLPNAPALGSFIVNTNAEGRDFALVGAGVVATPSQWHQSVSFFVNYDAQVGQNNFIAHTVDGGVRVNF